MRIPTAALSLHSPATAQHSRGQPRRQKWTPGGCLVCSHPPLPPIEPTRCQTCGAVTVFSTLSRLSTSEQATRAKLYECQRMGWKDWKSGTTGCKSRLQSAINTGTCTSVTHNRGQQESKGKEQAGTGRVRAQQGRQKSRREHTVGKTEEGSNCIDHNHHVPAAWRVQQGNDHHTWPRTPTTSFPSASPPLSPTQRLRLVHSRCTGKMWLVVVLCRLLCRTA